MPASGWGILWDSSPFVHWLVLNTFRDVSRTVPQWPWISRCMRKSRRDFALKMRFSVPPNSWDNFFVTLPPISSETWVMYSSCDLRTFEFCAKLLLGCPSQFALLKAASFLSFLRVAISTGRVVFSDLKGKPNWCFTVFSSRNKIMNEYWLISSVQQNAS